MLWGGQNAVGRGSVRQGVADDFSDFNAAGLVKEEHFARVSEFTMFPDDTLGLLPERKGGWAAQGLLLIVTVRPLQEMVGTGLKQHAISNS